MASRTYAKDAPNRVGEQIRLLGWVQVRRDHGKLIFLDLRDITGIIQVVVNSQVSQTAYDTAKTVRSEYVVEIEGKVNPRPEKLVNRDMVTGTVEIEATALKVLAEALPLPFDLDAQLNLDTYLDNQPLVLRNQKNIAVFKIQSAIVESFREYLKSEHFHEFQAPKIVAQAAEGGANVFRVDYFGQPAFLAQSPQLYKQIMVGVLERVFTVTSVYRAEPHATTRHLNEYVSMDLEMGFIQDHTDVMKIMHGWMKYLMAKLHAENERDFKTLGATIPAVPDQFPTFKLTQAQELLKKEYGIDAVGQPDLDPEHEKLLCQYSAEKLGSDFVFVTHYPTSKRPFYTFPDEKNPEETKSFDLLFRGVEITTGGQRINSYEQLLANIDKWGYKRENFSFYLEAFQYGMPPEGGCATGLERLTQKLSGLQNIKEATLFPRDLNRIDLPLANLKLEEENKLHKS